ncbi:MAG TPA: DUF5658 family protein [Phycisphaerae bacterium]|nr:DUF5658 family protein [Phycisphaerae bacterium]
MSTFSGSPHPEAARRREPWWARARRAVRTARGQAHARRARRVALILIFVWIVNLFDLVFTLIACELGGFRELNPLVHEVLHKSEQLILYKVSTVFAATLIIWAFRRRRITEIACWGLSVVYTVLAFLWTSYYAIVG